MTTPDNAITLQNLTRRSVRAWWVDGLWDFAVAGFLLLLAAWSYVLVRVIAFPTWTWPWPFITSEVINPMQSQLSLWTLAILPAGAAYVYGMYRLVSALKSRWLASRQGDARHPFWLKVEMRFLVAYVLVYLGLYVVVTWLVLANTGGERFFSTAIISALAAVLVTLGWAYDLRRYIFSGLAGLVLTILVELLLVTSADFQAGPANFLAVAQRFGNPALPLLVFAGLFVITGVVGLAQVLAREPIDEQA